MSTTVLLVVIATAFLHAVWNLGSRHYRERPGFVWAIGLWSGIWSVVFLPFTFREIEWTGVVFACGIFSAFALSVYYTCLAKAYRTGDISLVYPLIRSSPLWVAIIALIFLGETLSLLAWLGLVLTLLGVLVLPLGRIQIGSLAADRRTRRLAVIFAVCASFGTCGYTLSDKIAMDAAAIGPLAGVALTAISSVVKMGFWAVLDPKARVGFEWHRLSVPGMSPFAVAGFGLCIFAAYAGVICALIYADAGRVLAVNNLSVVLGAIGGIIFFKERGNVGFRLLGLALVVTGIVFLRLF